MKTHIFTLLLIVNFSSLANQNLKACRGDSGLFGFCNQEGEVVIPHQFYDAHDFNEGHASVLVEDKWGIINSSGDLVIKPIFDDMIECENTNHILVRQDTRWFLVNAIGESQTGEYDVADPGTEFKLNGAVAEFAADAWFAVSKKGKWGIIDTQNKQVLDFEYEWLKILRQPRSNSDEVIGVILKDKKEKYAWRDPSGLHTSGFIFDKFLGVNDKYIFFEKFESLAVLDLVTGDEVQVSGSEYFVLQNDKGLMGVVNARIGRVVIPFEYESIDNSQIPNHAITKMGYKVGLVNLFGDVLLPPEYEEIKLLKSNPLIIAVRDNSKKVAVVAVDANKLTPITPYKYTFARQDGDRIFIGVENRHGYLALNGEEDWD